MTEVICEIFAHFNVAEFHTKYVIDTHFTSEKFIEHVKFNTL